MSNSPPAATEYLLGHSEQELERLAKQAEILSGWTERIFRAAGLPGARKVLDIGCGAGDVSVLAARLVGPHGIVIGIDREAGAVAKARERLSCLACKDQVTFEHSEIAGFRSNETFDAVVGRYVMLYQPEPAVTLRHLASLIRPGGLLVFHEVDFGSPPFSWPEAPLWDSARHRVAEAFRRAGVAPDFPLRLTRSFLDAGLGWPSLLGEVAVGGGPGSYLYGWIADVTRTLLPRIEQLGLATTQEVDVETLAARLEAEAVALGSQLSGPTQYGAWVRKM